MNKTPIQTWEFYSKSSPGRKPYTTTKWEDGSYSCNCRGWTMKKKHLDYRTCTHIDQVGGEPLYDNGAQPIKIVSGPKAFIDSNLAFTKPVKISIRHVKQQAKKNRAPAIEPAVEPAQVSVESPQEEIKFFKPMLAQPNEIKGFNPNVGANKVFEPKFDGERVLVFVKNHRTLHAYTRKGNEAKNKNGMGWINDVQWPFDSGILDCEACPGTGVNRGQKKAKRARSRAGLNYQVMVFDLLNLNGQNLMRLPWYERRELLEAIFDNWEYDHPSVGLTPYSEDVKALWDSWVVGMGGEGIMVKNRNAVYEPGVRSHDWIKMKVNFQQDVVCIAVTDTASNGTKYKTAEVALQYGYYNPKTKDYFIVGQGGPGLLGKRAVLEKYAASHRVMEMSCGGVTPSGALLSGQFKRWRDDKDPEECVLT